MNTRPSDYAIVQAFRKRPVVIEAAGPITAVNFLAISQWCGGQAKTSLSIIIPTLEGDMRAEAGDWIIKGVKGEFYPCKPDIFAATYEPVEIDAARPEQVQDCRGYAHLGTGQYLINHSASGEPAELCISIATEEEKAGCVVGDSRDNAPRNLIQPESMVVRLRFENVDGLDALEHQLRLLRQVHFPCPTAEREDAELTTEHARVLQNIPKPDDPVEGAEDVEALSHAAVCSRLGDEQKDPVLRAALWDAAAHIRSHVAKPEGEAAVLAKGWYHFRPGENGEPDDYDIYDKSSCQEKPCPECVPVLIVRDDKSRPPRSHGVVVDEAMVERACAAYAAHAEKEGFDKQTQTMETYRKSWLRAALVAALGEVES